MIRSRKPGPGSIGVMALAVMLLTGGFARAQTLVFEDGFEIGNTTRWSLSFPPTGEPAEGLFISPVTVALPGIGAQADVQVMLRDCAEPLWGVELYLSYDADVVQVVSTGRGSCPPPELVVYDDYDNGSGLVRYAVVPLESGPCEITGGDFSVYSIRFERIAAGSSFIKFGANSILTDGEVAVSTPRQNGWIPE